MKLCMAACKSVLQDSANNARVAVVNDAFLQHMEASIQKLSSIVNGVVRTLCVHDMRWVCMHISAAQHKTVAQRVKETLHMVSQATQYVRGSRFVSAWQE